MSGLDLNIFKTILTDLNKANDFVTNYDASLFSSENSSVGKVVVDFVKTYKSLPSKRTLLDRHKDNPSLTRDISNLLDDLEHHDYDVNDYKYDLQLLKDRYKKRCLDKIKRSIAEMETRGEESDEIMRELSLLLRRASVIDTGRTHIQKPVGDHVEEFKMRYAAATEAGPDGNKNQIKTGYSMVDALTGGISPGEFILIGGETNAGKSMLLNNMGVQIWAQGNSLDDYKPGKTNFKPGHNVLYFSLEMPYDDCFDRFLARVAKIPQRAIRDGSLSMEQVERMNLALEFIKEYQECGNYFDIVDVPRDVTIEEVELRFQDSLLRFSPDVVIVDYMGLMSVPALSKEPDWIKLGAISASLHEFSRAYNVSVISASQLTDIKRGSAGKSKNTDVDESQRVGVHRIGRSSLIAHHINIGIQIETRPNEVSLPDMRYHVIKNRKGPLGQGSLIKNFECGSLYDVKFIDPRDISPSGPSITGGHDVSELIRRVKEGVRNSDSDSVS